MRGGTNQQTVSILTGFLTSTDCTLAINILGNLKEYSIPNTVIERDTNMYAHEFVDEYLPIQNINVTLKGKRINKIHFNPTIHIRRGTFYKFKMLLILYITYFMNVPKCIINYLGFE